MLTPNWLVCSSSSFNSTIIQCVLLHSARKVKFSEQIPNDNSIIILTFQSRMMESEQWSLLEKSTFKFEKEVHFFKIKELATSNNFLNN